MATFPAYAKYMKHTQRQIITVEANHKHLQGLISISDTARNILTMFGCERRSRTPISVRTIFLSICRRRNDVRTSSLHANRKKTQRTNVRTSLHTNRK